jgi:hypothetical protein
MAKTQLNIINRGDNIFSMMGWLRLNFGSNFINFGALGN